MDLDPRTGVKLVFHLPSRCQAKIAALGGDYALCWCAKGATCSEAGCVQRRIDPKAFGMCSAGRCVQRCEAFALGTILTQLESMQLAKWSMLSFRVYPQSPPGVSLL